MQLTTCSGALYLAALRRESCLHDIVLEIRLKFPGDISNIHANHYKSDLSLHGGVLRF